MKKILVFSLTYYPRFIGGAEVAIKEITDRIDQSEMQFDMVTLRLDASLPKFERIGNVNVHRVGWASKKCRTPDTLSWFTGLNKYAYLVTGLWKALSLHRQNHYDTMWSLMATYNSFTAILFKILHPEVRFVLTLQDGDPVAYIKRRALPLYPLFKKIFTGTDHIQTISKHLASWAKEMGAKCPVEVVPNAVDFELFSKTVPTDRINSIRSSLGIKSNEKVLITASRLVKKNAVDICIEALKFLSPEYKLAVLGIGEDEGQLKRQANDLGLQRRVVFAGFIPHTELPQYLKASDVFVRPSRSEGLGNSFLEAMTAGIPVIGTNVGGITDFLENEKTGYVVKVDDAEGLASTVKKIMSDATTTKQVVANAASMVRDRYAWGTVATSMKRIFLGKV
jgi:glycosyltransferase involved in cell wall biosynthesis